MKHATKDPKSFCPREIHRQQPVRESVPFVRNPLDKEPQSAEIEQSIRGAFPAAARSAAPPSTAVPNSQPDAAKPGATPTEPTKPPEVTVAHLREAMATPFFLAALQKVFGEGLSATTVQEYRSQVLAECQATDPVEIWLLEQLVAMRFTMGFLQASTITAKAIPEMAIVNNAACHLAGEFRRITQALDDHRAKLRSRSRKAADVPEDESDKATPCESNGGVSGKRRGKCRPAD